MKPYQERVVIEKKELDEKLEKLEAFFQTETFEKLDDQEKWRLAKQRTAMGQYSMVLSERINAFQP